METFNRLMDIVMTYTLGLREFEGQYYITLEDDIIDAVHYEEHMALRNKAIIELLSIEPHIAFRYLKRFGDINKEIERDFFKVRDYNSELTLEQVEGVAALRGVFVKRSAYRENTIVTTNFINTLENNIWARGFIVSQIEDALRSVIENKAPDPISIFVEAGVIDSLPKNPETDTFMDWNLWENIKKGTLITSKAKDSSESHTYRKDFSALLTDAGKGIFKDIQAYYKGAQPVIIFAVFYAMADLKLISDDSKNLFKLTRQNAADALGTAFQTSLSTQIVGYNIAAYEHRSDKQRERIEAAKVVITGFLNK